MATERSLSAWVTGRAVRVDVALLAALAAVAVLPFGRLFVDERFVWQIVGVVVVAFAVARITESRPVPVAAGAHLAAMVAYLVFVVFRVGVPTPTALRGVWNGTTGSWADLLTTVLPAVPTARLVALPVVVAWLAAVGGAEMAQRRPWVSAPLPFAIAAFTLSLLFTGQRPAHGWGVAAAFVALALCVVLVRANAQRAPVGASSAEGWGQDTHRRSLPGGQLRLGLPVVAVIAGLGSVVAAVSPFDSAADRTDLHTGYKAPLAVSGAVTPLAEVRPGLNDATGATAFTVRFTGVPDDLTIDRIAVARLDTYDGSVFGTDASYARTGVELAPGPAVRGPTLTVGQTYTLAAAYPSVFLPALQQPRTLTGEHIGFDRATGTFLTDAAVLDGFTYAVTSEVARSVPDATTVATATTASVVAPAPPGVWPAEMTAAAARLAPGAPGDPAALVALEAALRSTDFGYSTKARPGHSLAVLTKLLAAPATSGQVSGRVGYAEQFAAAFAVLARVKGFPSRVDVGYRVSPEAARLGDPIEIKLTDIHAWAEAEIAGVGWVAFDPTNPAPRTPEPPVATTVPPLTSSVVPTTALSPATTDVAAAAGTPPSPGPPLWPLVVLAALAALPVAVVVAKRLRRQRRRRRPSTASSVIGAWSEGRDRLRVSGVAVPPSATAAELAAQCEVLVGAGAASSVRAFSPLVDHALYAPDDPDPRLADDAWKAEADLAEALRDGSSVVVRARRAVDPRPLLGRRRS